MPIASNSLKVRNKGFQIREDQDEALKADVKTRNSLVTQSSLLRYLIDRYLALPEDKKVNISGEIAKIEKDLII